LADNEKVANPSYLMAQEKAREQRKLVLWKSRVNLVKRARANMEARSYSEAAASYEKYIRVIEVVFDAKPGELTPEQFKDSARTQELTLVASVYWDLLRIYDTNEKYSERQSLSAKKLAQFLPFTPIYPDILKKAEVFSKSARNPSLVRSFLKSATSTKARCFIATSAFQSDGAIEVQQLRLWRDLDLRNHFLGNTAISAYERLSPPVAEFLDLFPGLKPVVRLALRAFIWLFLGQRYQHEQKNEINEI
jgi:hypothetical protein